jgi:hypothetical protein
VQIARTLQSDAVERYHAVRQDGSQPGDEAGIGDAPAEPRASR